MNNIQLPKNDISTQIEKLAICYNTFNSSSNRFKAIHEMFVDLLYLLKQKQIKIMCGISMMEFLMRDPSYNPITKQIEFATCEISLELDFNLPKIGLSYNGIVLYREVHEDLSKNEIENVTKPKKSL